MTLTLQDLSDALAGAYAHAAASLVTVRSGQHGQGAGVIWSEDGLIATSAHVLKRGTTEVMLPDGHSLAARLVGRHRDHDLALLRVDASGLPAAEIGASQAVRPGEWVLALGHPWGIPGGATAGVVIGAGRNLPENPWPGREWIAVNLHYRPGHSGGPPRDAGGRVLGLNTVMTGPSVGLAVPAHLAVDLAAGQGHTASTPPADVLLHL